MAESHCCAGTALNKTDIELSPNDDDIQPLAASGRDCRKVLRGNSFDIAIGIDSTFDAWKIRFVWDAFPSYQGPQKDPSVIGKVNYDGKSAVRILTESMDRSRSEASLRKGYLRLLLALPQ